MIYLLDTDHISVLQRGGPTALPLLRRLQQLSPDDFGTTIITYEEQCRGRVNRIHQANTAKERVEAYQRLGESLRFFAAIAVWEYTAAAEEQFAALGALRLGAKDRLIGAIALANEAVVLTRNRRDFERIPGLVIEDWTQEHNG